MTLIRKLNKLRRMSPRELQVRTRELLRIRQERREWLRRRHSAHPQRHMDWSVSRFQFDVSNLVPGACPGQITQVRVVASDLLDELTSGLDNKTNEILSGDFRLLGIGHDLRQNVNWHRCPHSGFHWPSTFYNDVLTSKRPDNVDVKLVWELGRQQFVAELACHSLLASSGSANAGIPPSRPRDFILDWITHNRLYVGVHWTSALEVAVRSISWIWAIAALSSQSVWSGGELECVADSLAEHAGYLEQHLSLYSSPYNHLIGEATALYLIGRALSQSPQSKTWIERATSILREHGPRQFYADGFCVEQATGYHFFTLGFLTLAIAAARSSSDGELVDLETLVHRAYRTGIRFRQPDGRWPPIGDLDSARAIPVLPKDYWDFNGLCSVGAVLFRDPEIVISDRPGAELYWLLGANGISDWIKLANGKNATHEVPPAAVPLVPCPVVPESAEETGPSGVTILKESGYVIGSRGGDWLLFDVGPIAAGLHADSVSSVAHGHADSLQVLYMHKGRAMLHDSGMLRYAGPRAWVSHFRSPGAHNTICVEGATQAREAGHLAWSHVNAPPAFDACETQGLWFARARSEWANGVVIERSLLCIPESCLWICDWVKPDTTRNVEWYWQLAANDRLDLARSSASSWQLTGDDFELRSWVNRQSLECSLESSTSESPVAWTAEEYGSSSPGRRARFHTRVSAPLLAVHYVGSGLPSFTPCFCSRCVGDALCNQADCVHPRQGPHTAADDSGNQGGYPTHAFVPDLASANPKIAAAATVDGWRAVQAVFGSIMRAYGVGSR